MTAAPSAEHERFLALLCDCVAQGNLVKLALGKPRAAQPDRLRVFVRPLQLRGQACLSFVQRHATRDETHNLAVDAGLRALREMVLAEFDHAHLITRTQDVQLMRSRKGAYALRVGKAAVDAGADADAPHDREKQRWLDLGRPFLAALGVTDAAGRLVPAMARKWKQINKFVEVLQHAIDASALAADAPLRVLDFGSGKGYLTFAMHDHLSRTRAAPPQVTGVELRPDMVALCNGVAQRLPLPGLAFEQGDVQQRTPQPLDIMVALHACDTATDHAMHMGVRSGAAIILCAPCCHKQIRPQMHSPAALRPMLQHGIHMGQQAEMVTDSVRALLLEACGYSTQVFEFVSLEHTSKNKMVLAVKRHRAGEAAPALAQVADIKAFYGIREHCLETLLLGSR